jgi:hypothetical protein
VTRSGALRPRSLPELVSLPRRSPLYPELACALAAADALHVLRSDLDPVPVRPTSTTREAGCYRLRQADPVDLRVSRRHGRVAIGLLHELGHFVDHQLGAHLGPTWASGRHEGFAAWRAAAARLRSRVPAGTSRSKRRYFDSVKEVWARSYAQTVLAGSAHPWLQGQLRALLASDDMFVWPEHEFAPVAAELELVLATLGLLRPRPLALAA